jgi:nitrite reductase/ring-hydroxylating ferredoxin subunit
MNRVKITKIFITVFLMLTCITCKKEPTEVFPNASFSVSVNLITNNIGIGTADSIPNAAKLGAAGKGILVYNADGISYIAYSALCTNYPKDTSAVIINGLIAQCPKCKSRFLLSEDGSVLNGVAKYPLKQYSVSVIDGGNTLVIQN